MHVPSHDSWFRAGFASSDAPDMDDVSAGSAGEEFFPHPLPYYPGAERFLPSAPEQALHDQLHAQWAATSGQYAEVAVGVAPPGSWPIS